MVLSTKYTVHVNQRTLVAMTGIPWVHITQYEQSIIDYAESLGDYICLNHSNSAKLMN